MRSVELSGWNLFAIFTRLRQVYACFFSCTRPLLVFLWSQLHWVQSSIYVDGLWVLLILIFALNGMDQGSNYHTVVAVWWPTEAPEIVLPCSKNKVTDRFINWKGDTRITSPNVVCYISEIQCGEMIKQRLLNPQNTWEIARRSKEKRYWEEQILNTENATNQLL